MTHRNLVVTAAIVVCALLATPSVLGQRAADWQGQDSEFGSIRAPYTLNMEGERVALEARVTLRDLYEEQESRFFMFAFTVENTPLDVNFESLVRTDTGQELPCYQREGSANTAIKCFVDLRDMPPAGTEIRMHASVGSSGLGMSQVGAMVVPFTYTWMRVQMSNGLNAELYAGTQMNVVECPNKCGGLRGAGGVAAIPGAGVVGVAAAALVALGVAAIRRKA